MLFAMAEPFLFEVKRIGDVFIINRYLIMFQVFFPCRPAKIKIGVSVALLQNFCDKKLI